MKPGQEYSSLETGGLRAVAASLTGNEHRARGSGCQDRFALVRGASDSALIAVVSDGVGTTRAAGDAARAAADEVAAGLADLTPDEIDRLADDGRAWDARVAAVVRRAAVQVTKVEEPVRSDAAIPATTVSAAIVVPRNNGLVVAWLAVGDSPLLVLEDSGLTEIWNPSASRTTAALPHDPGRVVSGIDVLSDRAVLMVLSDGLAEVVLGVPSLAERLVASAGDEETFLELAGVGHPGAHDDRTAVLVQRDQRPATAPQD